MPSVLVVDDDNSTLVTFRLGLQHAGYDVDVSDSGVATCRTLERTLPDAILLDLKMPGMDGYGVLEWMRNHDVLVPTAVMTGFLDSFEPSDAMALGAAMFLHKPLFIESLLQALQRLIKPDATETPIADASSAPTRSDLSAVLRRLHPLVIAGQPDAREQVAREILDVLPLKLQRAFPRAPHFFVAQAVEDAILDYLNHPTSYHASRSMPITRFLYAAAWRNLTNRVKSEASLKAREEKYAIAHRSIATERHADFEEPEYERLLQRLLGFATNDAEREALHRWFSGNGSTASVAAALGLSHLDPAHQQRDVKRFKDRLLKRVLRHHSRPGPH